MSTKQNSDSKQTDRRVQTRELVKKLVAERKEMLVLFCRAAGLGSVVNDEPVDDVVQRFCEVLIDYVAAGHFTLYDRIAAGKERRNRVREVAAQVYPRLSATTDAALEFNDTYSAAGTVTDMNKLAHDLSRLGEHIAARIELEDQLLNCLE